MITCIVYNYRLSLLKTIRDNHNLKINIMKNLRKVYENKIRKDDFIPTEEQLVEYEKDITSETKEDDGCKVVFVFYKKELIGALCTDESLDMEDSKLDTENTNAAYADFDLWLNA